MKDYRIVYVKGEPLVVEWPEAPDFKKLKKDKNYQDYKFFTGYKDKDIQKQHEKEIESAIANGVPPNDKEQVLAIVLTIVHNLRPHKGTRLDYIEDNHPYSLEGYEVKVEDVEPETDDEIHLAVWEVEHGKPRTQFKRAIITPKEKETIGEISVKDCRCGGDLKCPSCGGTGYVPQ